MHGIDGGPLDKHAKPVAYPTYREFRESWLRCVSMTKPQQG